MGNVKVLIAEDTPDILELISDKVTSEGFDVIQARNGAEAWDKICQENPDIILLDLMMPQMDGFAVLERLRANPPSKKWQPVIIVSALSDLKNMRKCFDLEAEHYITKPFHPHDIIRGIHQMLKLIPHHKTAME